MADFYTSMNSPVGPLTVFETDGAIIALEWGRVPASRSSPLLNDATRQLTAYFDGHLETFDLPIAPAGSDFQHRVWQAMSEIPYGRTETYGELAQRIGGVARAVGGACGANPIPILIPCHRVTGAGGRMTGYSAGEGIETKRALLRLEGATLI
ncbi:MAG: cysteine methyltransferase [Rhodospirillaceae bacterium]|nr:cysteine methyltransferase [Rhodospirillaceae bacterium]|tara:strand:- start:106 stop:564 length:459 start_codon:yes stop_codon:yes gene_type:complete